MTSSPTDVALSAPASSVARVSAFYRRLFLIIGAVALVYALLAGLRHVYDFDLGWQLATGRWIVQHHHVPSTDVLSYTAYGAEWVHPIGSEVILYLAYLLGGYSLLSWMGAAACVGAVALLLRQGSVMTAALAVLAVPLIAMRTTPRADMFTVVLFAAVLSLLWEQHRTGRAKLWWLPLLMLLWVNLHFGFIAGLGLMGAYVGADLLEAITDRSRRAVVMQRLLSASGWLAGAALATLVNPWGWGIYRTVMDHGRANAAQQFWISEWTPVSMTWASIQSALWLRQTAGTVYLLLAFAIVGVAIALLRAQFDAAILLIAAMYVGIHYARMGSVFACVVVIVAGPILSTGLHGLADRIRVPRVRRIAAIAATVLLIALVSVRAVDLVSNRYYLSGIDETTFGTGLSWWFPQRAAEFIEQQNLPGQIFNTYDVGGYVAWRLGPQRLVYLDGRDIMYGVERIQRHSELLQASPDSPEWQQEAARYNINTLLLPLGRFDGIQLIQLQDFCASKTWQPVYLDEVSAVFVRRTPQTEELRQHFPVNCSTARLPAATGWSSRADAFNGWANAAAVLAALDRNAEALNATQNALAIAPYSFFAHWLRGNVLFAMGRMQESDAEYLKAIELGPNEVTWSALASSYEKRGRIPDAIDAYEKAVQFSVKPYSLLLKLGYIHLGQRDADEALKAFDSATHDAPKNIRAADNGTFDFMVAQGRSVAWGQLGDRQRSLAFQEEAAQIEPDAPEPWRRLAKLYRQSGRESDATLADAHATAAAAKRNSPSP